MLHFFGLEVPECCLWISNKGKPPYAIWLIKVPCCSPLPEAKDGVEPSFQDLQSDTFPLCYLAKPATSCAKVKRLFLLPRSLFFYICGGGLPEKRGQLLSPLLHFPFLIESSVQRPDRSFLQQRTDRSSCKQPCIEFCLVLLKVNKQRPAAFFISLAVSPSSAFRLPRLYFIVSKAVNVSAILLPLDL